MMKEPEKKHSIKIFTGVHAGTELPLDNGEYRIGAADDCDIILDDCRDEQQIIRLVLEDSRIVVQRENGPCWIEGVPMNGEEIEVEKFSTVTLGSAHLAIGPSNEKWPQFKPPQIRSEVSTVGDAVSPNDANDARTAQQDRQLSERVEKPFSRRRKFVMTIMASIIILLLLNVTVSFDPQENNNEMQVDQAMQDLETVLATLPVERAAVGIGGNNELVVSGMLRSRAAEENIVKQIKRLPYEVVVRMDAVDEILPMFDTVLDNYKLDLNVNYNEEGKFVLNGFARDDALVRQIVTRLQDDLPAAGQLDVKVQTHETLIPQMFEDIEHLGGIQGRLEIQAHADYIRASGELFPEDRGVWTRARQKIEKRYGSSIKFQERFTTKPGNIRNKETAGKEPVDPVYVLKQMIAGLTYGSPSYIISNHGRKLFEGAIVENGFVVNTIMPDKVIFEKNGKPIIVDMSP